MPFEARRWLSCKEFSERTGLSISAVRHKIARKQIPISYALGKRTLRIDYLEIQRRLEQEEKNIIVAPRPERGGMHHMGHDDKNS
jgi:predicted DNA-binding transcriptional regulator AlpA